MKLRCIVKSIIVLCGLGYSVASFANCDGVITNSSNKPWTVQFLEDEQYGNVYFSGGVSCSPNGPCVIPAKSFAKIEYTQTRGVIFGHVKLTDSNNKSVTRVYHNDWFFTCPSIKRISSEPNMQYNIPDNGSIQIGADNF